MDTYAAELSHGDNEYHGDIHNNNERYLSTEEYSDSEEDYEVLKGKTLINRLNIDVDELVYDKDDSPTPAPNPDEGGGDEINIPALVGAGVGLLVYGATGKYFLNRLGTYYPDNCWLRSLVDTGIVIVFAPIKIIGCCSTALYNIFCSCPEVTQEEMEESAKRNEEWNKMKHKKEMEELERKRAYNEYFRAHTQS